MLIDFIKGPYTSQVMVSIRLSANMHFIFSITGHGMTAYICIVTTHVGMRIACVLKYLFV